MSTPLNRCLSWWHLTFFGVGQMAGAGVYVLTGTVVATTTGPATFISYIIAGVCAFLAALCYAEFGARCPKAGSAYTYAYVTIGELLGFTIGWNLLLEHSIGAASTARAWGGALNSLTNNAIRNWTLTYVGEFELFGSKQYPDIFAVLVIVLLSGIVLYGAKFSMTVTAIITIINVFATAMIVTVGLSLADVNNWTQPDGFAPNGVTGIISGAAVLFYAYVGFDAIAMAGEEAKNPAKSLPIANMLSILIVMVFYVSMSIALTLAVPYNMVDTDAAFSSAFGRAGMHWAKVLVNVVTLIVIQGSTISALYAGPRCSYSMASDGLMFRCFAYVHPKTQTPMVSILVFSTVSAVSALLLDLETLAEFVSLGTLMASFFVSGCVIILRYRGESDTEITTSTAHEVTPLTSSQSLSVDNVNKTRYGQLKPAFQNIPWLSRFEAGLAVKYAVVLLGVCLLAGLAMMLYRWGEVWLWYQYVGVSLCGLGLLLAYIVIIMHVQNQSSTTFQVIIGAGTAYYFHANV